MTAGVYQIRNRQTGEVYVGGSVNVTRRIRYHLWSLRNRHHENSRLQQAWEQYGAPSFSFCLLESVGPDGSLIEAERRWFDAVRGRVSGVYNMAPIRDVSREARRPTQEATGDA